MVASKFFEASMAELTVVMHPLLLIVSYDGFRHNYFEKQVTPTLQKLKTLGTHAEYMRNVFETKTFPNHHSIATGLFPEVHGVLANSLYDPIYKRVLNFSYELWHQNENIIPIWRLNENSGEGRYSGVMMWPGGGFTYQNTLPTHLQNYNTSISWEERVDMALGWFLHPVTPANLVMLYFEEPDASSHIFGPESPQVLKQLAKLDRLTDYLHHRLVDNNLSDVVNVFHLSDHGMDTVTLDRIVNLTDYVDRSTYITSGSSPNASLHDNFSVFKRADIPERWHFKNNNRTPPILAVADEGYAFDDLFVYQDYYIHNYNITREQSVTKPLVDPYNVVGDHVSAPVVTGVAARGPRARVGARYKF
uniref:Uncharacterized protein n=1 Tax=Timema cristinae TaxID=61476 RepID=A0A7R9GSA5_TIMCR|nr:unnamed protein product [Timema cristinae]